MCLSKKESQLQVSCTPFTKALSFRDTVVSRITSWARKWTGKGRAGADTLALPQPQAGREGEVQKEKQDRAGGHASPPPSPAFVLSRPYHIPPTHRPPPTGAQHHSEAWAAQVPPASQAVLSKAKSSTASGRFGPERLWVWVAGPGRARLGDSRGGGPASRCVALLPGLAGRDQDGPDQVWHLLGPQGPNAGPHPHPARAGLTPTPDQCWNFLQSLPGWASVRPDLWAAAMPTE